MSVFHPRIEINSDLLFSEHAFSVKLFEENNFSSFWYTH